MLESIKQNATGGYGVTWPSNTTWAGGVVPAFTATANAVDVVKFVYDGTNFIATGTTLDTR